MAAATEVAPIKGLSQEQPHSQRKRFKITELPLSPNQKSTIDSLLHTIKKKGEYDALRKRVWDQYVESDANAAFTDSLHELAEAEIDRDPSLLSRERGKAATLMQGAVDRSDIYKSVERSLDSLIAEHVTQVELVAREFRKKEIGEDAAAEEEQRGNKPDEEYAREAAVRREAREYQNKQEEARKRREEEVEKLRAEEAKKKAELEKLRRADERRRERKAREEERAKAREAHRALLKQEEKEEELRRQERHERRRKEELENSRAAAPSRDRLRSTNREPEGTPRSQDTVNHRSQSQSNAKSPTPPTTLPTDEKALEVAALELLLREGRELAAKSGNKIEHERSESLEPPLLRKSLSVKPPKLGEPSPPKGPAADRSRSPAKAITIPKGPKLSYSQTNHAQGILPPEAVARGRSPSNTHMRHESSREDYKSQKPGAEPSFKGHSSSRYEADDPYRKPHDLERSPSRSGTAIHGDERHSYHDSRRTTSRRDYDDEHEDRGYERGKHYDREREKHRDYDYEKDRYRSSRDHDHEKDRYRSSREYEHEREPHRSSRYDRSRSRDREAARDRTHDRDRRYTRSRSPGRSTLHGSSGYIEPRGLRDRPRAKSPVEIDRYVPSTSSRAKELEPRVHRTSRYSGDAAAAEDEDRHRERERGRYPDRDKERDGERERYEDKERYRDREKDAERERYEEKDRYRDREKDRERDRYEHEKEKYRERERDKDRDRDRYEEKERYREREKERERDRYGDRERDRYGEKDRYGEREREKKPFVEIDRYVPGGGDRGRDRERDR